MKRFSATAAAAVVLVLLGLAAPTGAVAAVPRSAPAAALADAACGPRGGTGAYPPSSAFVGLSTTVFVRGQSGILTAAGFAKAGQVGAGTTVTITLCSTPIVLGTATVDPGGRIRFVLVIPQQAALGVHTVVAQGPNGVGGTTTLSTNLTVVLPTTVLGETTARGGTLPFTGANIIVLIITALLLIVVGASLVAVARRRRRHA